MSSNTPTPSDPQSTPAPSTPETEISQVDTPPQGSQRIEEFTLSGDALLAKIRELAEESNVRRIVIKTSEDHTLIEIPLTVGVAVGVLGTVLAPVLAAVGAIGALVANLKIIVERTIDE